MDGSVMRLFEDAWSCFRVLLQERWVLKHFVSVLVYRHSFVHVAISAWFSFLYLISEADLGNIWQSIAVAPTDYSLELCCRGGFGSSSFAAIARS